MIQETPSEWIHILGVWVWKNPFTSTFRAFGPHNTRLYHLFGPSALINLLRDFSSLTPSLHNTRLHYLFGSSTLNNTLLQHNFGPSALINKLRAGFEMLTPSLNKLTRRAFGSSTRSPLVLLAPLAILALLVHITTCTYCLLYNSHLYKRN